MCARKQAVSVGWLLKETQALGDCGIDCMAYYDEVARSDASWRKIRHEIYMFMNSVKHIPTWQDAFVACQEVDESSNVSKSWESMVGGMGPPSEIGVAQHAAIVPYIPQLDHMVITEASGQPSQAVASVQATCDVASGLGIEAWASLQGAGTEASGQICRVKCHLQGLRAKLPTWWRRATLL